MRKLSLLICVVMAFVTVVGLLPVKAEALTFSPDFDIYSEAAYLVNLDTGEVIYEKNADKQLVPASLTKIMTAIILIEKYKDNISALANTYVSGTSACFDELYMTGASTADIRIGEKVSYKDLLYALMLRSACEAANIIAYNVAGSLEEFVEMMNIKAEELGCRDTHFTNSHGLFWENHYTTARDMAKILDYALSLPMFAEISCSESYTMEATAFHKERVISHTNYMMSKVNGGDYYYEYVKGIKTGTLDEAGRCLATLAYKDGYSYMLITLNAPMKDANGNNVFYNFIDHKKIYEWSFANFEYTTLLNGSEEKAEVPVSYGDGVDYVIVKPDKEFSRIWNTRIPVGSVHEIITLEKNVIAPIKAGQKLGTVELQYSGETLAIVDLVATSDVARSERTALLTVAKSFIGSNQFYQAAKYSVGFFIIYTVLIIVLKVIVAKNNKKRSRMYSAPKRRR